MAAPLKVLLVTYSFPPTGGVGVLRAASLARYLPLHDVDLDVLTTRNPSAVGLDLDLARDIPSGVRIHRTFTPDIPFGLKKRLKGLISGRSQSGPVAPLPPVTPSWYTGEFDPLHVPYPIPDPSEMKTPGLVARLKGRVRDLMLPDPQVLWVPIALQKAIEIIRERSVELVLITVPPFSTALLAAKLRRRFPNLPIVLDFRDEWLSTAFNLFSFSASDKARRVARDAEAAAVQAASVVVAASENARDEIHSRYPKLSADRFFHIPNGYDQSRIGRVERAQNPTPRAQDERILVTHVGTVYRTGDPTPFISALKSLAPEARDRFRFRFIGRIENPAYRDQLLSLGDVVELRNFMPQREALAALAETDFALLIQHCRLNVVQKFYDYIGSGKPILGALHPQGEVRNLFEKTGAGLWAHCQDVDALRRMIEFVARDGKQYAARFKPKTEVIAAYERAQVAARYADLLWVAARHEHDPAALAAVPERNA